MIGVLCGEDNTYLEFRPMFCKYRFGFQVKLPFKFCEYGEYGVSFSGFDTIWWHWEYTTYLYYPFDAIKNIFKKLK